MKSLNTIKNLILRYKHGLILSYFFVYMLWFTYLERTITDESKFTRMYCKLDDLIPFVEIFVIPYFLWFLYIFITVAYFFLTSRSEFYKICAFLFIGMTICLVIYTLWPNGHELRVNIDSLGRSNIFLDILSRLYGFDTATNVFPSIHVFNSIGAMIAIHKNERLLKLKWLQWSALVLTVSICLSTVFLKQHSVLDLFGGIGLSIIMYALVYLPSWDKVFKQSKHEFSKASQ